jgi:hypothetical protein
MRFVRHSILRRDLGILALYSLLALVLTYPLIAHFDAFGPGHGVDDPAQTWSLWWFKYATFNLGTSPLSSDYIFYPLGINLVAYTPTFLNGLISIPLQFVFGVIVAQNLIVLFSLVAGGYGAYLFVREVLSQIDGYAITASETIAAALAGAIYAFGAWHLNYAVAGHFMLLSNEWIPYFALYLIRWPKSRWQSGVRAGLFFVMAAWTELTFAPFLAVLTLMYLCYQIVLQVLRTSWKNSKGARSPGSIIAGLYPIILNLLAMGAVSAAGIGPLVLNLFTDFQRYGYYLTSGVGRIQIFSAEPISFFLPSAQHPWLGTWANGLTTANTSYAFIGYAVLFLAGLGFYAQRGAHSARFYALAAIFFALIMLGPTLIIGGQSTGIPMPFGALRAIPFVNANRYPVRFNVMLMLMLAPLIAFGATRMLRTVRGQLAFGALAALLVFEQLVLPIPLSDLRVPPIYQTIRGEPGDYAILELPLGWRGSIELQGKLEDRAQFFQTVHDKRLLGGITSRTPQFKTQYFLELPVINSLIALETGRELDDVRLAQDRAAAPAVLRFFNIRYVDINRTLAGAQVEQYARDVFPMKEIYRDDTRTLYRVDAMPSPKTIDPADETARLYYDDGWGRVQTGADGRAFRWATRDGSLVWLPLVQEDQTVMFRLRGVSVGQSVQVNVNDHTVADLKLSEGWNKYSVDIPAAILRDGLDDFAFAAATTPSNATHQDDYLIGDTGVTSPVDISATGAGFDAGSFGEIYVDGKNAVDDKRGYQLVAVNAQSGLVDRVASFDTFADANESARLAQFIELLPRGEIIAGVAIDDVSSNLKQNAIDALRSIGVEADLRYQFRAGHAFISVKGAAEGQALEQVNGRFPANVSVGKNVASGRVAFALGEIDIVTRGE